MMLFWKKQHYGRILMHTSDCGEDAHVVVGPVDAETTSWWLQPFAVASWSSADEARNLWRELVKLK